MQPDVGERPWAGCSCRHGCAWLWLDADADSVCSGTQRRQAPLDCLGSTQTGRQGPDPCPPGLTPGDPGPMSRLGGGGDAGQQPFGGPGTPLLPHRRGQSVQARRSPHPRHQWLQGQRDRAGSASAASAVAPGPVAQESAGSSPGGRHSRACAWPPSCSPGLRGPHLRIGVLHHVLQQAGPLGWLVRRGLSFARAEAHMRVGHAHHHPAAGGGYVAAPGFLAGFVQAERGAGGDPQPVQRLSGDPFTLAFLGVRRPSWPRLQGVLPLPWLPSSCTDAGLTPSCGSRRRCGSAGWCVGKRRRPPRPRHPDPRPSIAAVKAGATAD